MNDIDMQVLFSKIVELESELYDLKEMLAEAIGRTTAEALEQLAQTISGATL